jgi:hypothetical protein
MERRFRRWQGYAAVVTSRDGHGGIAARQAALGELRREELAAFCDVMVAARRR